ncbi:PAAR domain-containing protein [Nannocystis sp. RBIL2]|uniref:PAAR domain-containing protein n=1 Tax=Nannocystis sp. RBIL2 TaxID=2996788 RepID=UPI00226FAED2|nr:PAAR domain-containing protein [Nannocystis sp. RBIL2]MCY1065497.1 PAAR domain-containing protein [Nannocystis sp. RBIL2]
MSGAAVARVTDPIEHSPGLLGFAVGAVVGAVAVVAIAVATAATGGAALIALAAAGAVGGGIAGELLARAFGSNITTGALSQGYEDVHVNNLHMVAVGKKCEPCWIPIVFPHGETIVVEGSGTVLVHCAPVTRVGDQLLCDAIVGAGSPNVFVGGPKHRVKGTEKGLLDFLLPRLGFVITATTIAVFPASALGSLGAVGLYQADYGTYKGINTAVGNALGIDPGYAAIGIELTIGMFGGAAAGKLPRVGSWNATSSVARSQSWQRYLAKKAAEGKTPWSYQRWSQNWTHLVGKQGVRPGTTRNQRLNNVMTSLLSAGPLELGSPDLLSAINSAFQKAMEIKPPEGHDCDASWHAPAPG